MQTIDFARELVSGGQIERAQEAYSHVAAESEDPLERLEAAMYILQSGGDYQIAYRCFLELYKQGHFREDMLSVMTEAFYEPNMKDLRARYERNCKLLRKYPYIFRTDFLPFEELPIRFFPFDDDGYLPFHIKSGQFDAYIDFKNPVISRNFFKSLEKPVLSADVYSQYELEYLNDNVRASEYIGRENHIYLHYTDWGAFCAYLQCLNLRPLLAEQKIVFLIEDEIAQYPIDFKLRFGVDYSRHPLRPVGVGEVKRLIWHTQLATHNGGDFFNEVFDAHPNLLCTSSVMYRELIEGLKEIREAMNRSKSLKEALVNFRNCKNPGIVEELYRKRDRSEKDFLVAYCLLDSRYSHTLDPASRIAPALFFQPHFGNIVYRFDGEPDHAKIHSEEYEIIKASPVFKSFKYIKTFTPIRRITTSCAASIKFMCNVSLAEVNGKENSVIPDNICQRLLNRSFMRDPEDRLFKDSVMVRFEDGKLNPKATFTALSAFLDLPYTETMTECTERGEPAYAPGSAVGFDPVTVYRTYDEYMNHDEGCVLEYFMRDIYAYCSYDFHYCGDSLMDESRIRKLLAGFTTLDGHIQESVERVINSLAVKNLDSKESAETFLERYMNGVHRDRKQLVDFLLKKPLWVNSCGHPLEMMPLLKLDPALLEQPLYH